jgi:hypothetical protein
LRRAATTAVTTEAVQRKKRCSASCPVSPEHGPTGQPFASTRSI